MKRLANGLGVLAATALGLTALFTGPAAAKDPTIKEVMARLHKGANCPLILVKKELQGAQVDWDDVQKTSKEFVVLGGALAKNNPPRGARDSWTKLTRQYLEAAQALDAAAKKKDKTAALAAQAKLAGSCASCHKAHRD